MAAFDTDKGVELEIPLGSISPDSLPSILNSGQREYDRLYGLSQKGDHITLIDAFGNTGVSIPGFTCENWYAQKAIVSRGQFFETDPLIEHTTVAIDGLFEWCRLTPVKATYQYGRDDKWVGAEISTSSEVLKEIPLYESERVSVSLSPVVTMGGGELPLKTQSLTSDCHLSFQFFANLPTLSQAIDDFIVEFRDLLSFFMGFRAEILSISAKAVGVERPIKVYVPFVEASRDGLPKRAFQQMPLTFPKVRDKFQSIAERWFGLTDDARRAANIMLGVLANERSVYLDSKFIAAASAFEALSRVGHNTKELPREKFDEYLAAVQRDITNKHVRDWACYRLKDANFTSAGNLANQMLSEMEPYASYVAPNLKRFKKDHRNTRNAFIHQNDDVENGKALSGEELHVHTEAVLFLVYGKLLTMLGVTPQELIDALKSSSFHGSQLHRARRLYRVEEAGAV